jgi:hypothetical protein
MTALVPNDDGSLWSEQLASFLLADKQLLRLADAAHHLRLTGEEAQAQARWAAEQQVQRLLEKLRLQGIDPDRL